MNVRRVLPVFLALVLLGGGCTTTTAGFAMPAPLPPRPDLLQFYEQELAWGPCESFARSDTDRGSFADPRYDCTYVTVPLDYAEPAGEVARIGVLRKRAADPESRIGSLLTNPGGPGSSGMSLVPALAPGLEETPLGQRFDLVGFDPRGVGASEPVIDCLTDAERDEDREDPPVGDPSTDAAVYEAEAQEFVDRCVERVGVDVLANVGTRDVARDLDILRAALGDEKLTYLGYSYGTRIGASYAEAFPANVRALVLDGAVDPSQSEVESTVAQYAGFQLSFDAFAADCATRPGCPLGQDPSQAVTVFQELVRPLAEAPVAGGEGRMLGYSDAITGTIRALYSEEIWEILELGLAELTVGRGRVMLALADDYESRSQEGTYDNSLEALPVINCVDAERITDPAVFLEIDTRVREVAPFVDDGRPPVAARSSCAFWPVPPTSEPRLPDVPGLPPVLVISITGDPATPYEAGVTLARLLDGRLLSVDGNQHTVALTGVTCVDDAVTAYLVDLTLPANGASCVI